MKKLILFLMLIHFCISISSKDLFRIDNNKVVSVDYYSLYYDYDIDHNSNKYIVFGDSCSFATSNYFYKVKALQLNDSEYYEDWGDSLFSKLEIKCFDFKGNMVRRHEFINDEQWSRFNYWDFAAYTDHPWRGQGREICKVIPLAPNCMAIVLRGFRDSIDPEHLTVFVVYEDQVQLVYHKNIEINKMFDTATGVRYDLQTVDYDEDGRMIPQYFHMDFGQGKITIE